MDKQLLLLQETGVQKLFISDKQNHLQIEAAEGAAIKLYMEIADDVEVLDMKMNLQKQCEVSLFIKNAAQGHLTLKQCINVQKDASLQYGYCDLGDGERLMKCHICLLEEGAQADMMSVGISASLKEHDICIEHLAPHTKGEMHHYALVEKQGSYVMNACGKIIKGAYDSVSHQATRVLTMSEQHHSSITPTLLIDENDVKASHAMTLGQPDENQLYYLQTRGLSRQAALGLLSIGYLLPILAYALVEDEQQNLKDEIEKRVGLHA